jgi:hypothetical protein
LLHRLYDISGQTALAQKALRRVLDLTTDTPEAAYRSAVLLIKEHKEIQGLSQLQTLIKQDRQVYLKVLFEPAFAACQQVVYFFLASLVHAAHAEATAQMMAVIEALSVLRQWYQHQETDFTGFENTLVRMRDQLHSNSYFGYYDAAYEGSMILEQIRQLLPQRQAAVQQEFQTTLTTVRQQLHSLVRTSMDQYDSAMRDHLATLQDQLTQLGDPLGRTTPQQFWSAWETLQQLKAVVCHLSSPQRVSRHSRRHPYGLWRRLWGFFRPCRNSENQGSQALPQGSDSI